MRRISPQGDASELPLLDIENLSEDHQLYLRHMLGLVETGDMFHGRFVEVHVGAALGADIADRGINSWDLCVPGDQSYTVEVKAAAVGRKFKIGPKDADVWVFVTFVDKQNGPAEFRYVVAPREAVEALGHREVRQKTIFAQFAPEVSRDELAAAAGNAARLTRRRDRQPVVTSDLIAWHTHSTSTRTQWSTPRAEPNSNKFVTLNEQNGVRSDGYSETALESDLA